MKTLKRALFAISILVIIVFGLFLFNETTDFVARMHTISPQAGQISLIVLLVIYAILLLIPIVALFRYKKLPEYPETIEGPEYDAYVLQVKENLERNKLVRNEVEASAMDESAEEFIGRSYAALLPAANAVIKKEASSVFVTTAVSQNGALDGLFVLVSLIKLIYRLLRMYEVRPNIRRIIQLYSNVFGTVLLARTIEDMDLIEDQIEPLLATVLGGSVVSLLPGAQSVTNMIVSSVTEGAINALLTLRVGAITRRYLTSVTKPEKNIVRRQASLEAAALLGSIIKDNGIAVVKAFGKATKQATKTTLGL